jgi:nitrite reductase (NADH) large subunit
MLYAIIGNGAAGTEAVKAIRSRDAEGEIILIDADPNRCYYRPMLPDYVCGLKKKESLWVVDEGFYRSNRVDFRAGIRVEEVLPQEGKLRSDDGEEVRFDRLLLACGSAPRRLDCPGAELEGVVYLRTLEQAERIKELAAGAKQAVAVGGGLLGVELARLFNELGLKTTYLLREDRFWPQMLDEVGSALVERRLAEKGIRVLKQEGVQEIGGRGGKVRELHTTQGESIPAELVGVAIGVVPSVGFLEGSGIDAGGGVIVDQRLQSNSEGVFAAGDAARAYDPVHGEHRVNTSWMGAQRSGRIAGLNMAGGEEELPGSIAFNLINIYGLPVACLGLNLAEGEGYQSLYGDYPKGDVYKKYVLRDGRLVGATLIGDVAEARTLEELITAGADLGGVKERLFEEGFDLRSAARGLLGG